MFRTALIGFLFFLLPASNLQADFFIGGEQQLTVDSASPLIDSISLTNPTGNLSLDPNPGVSSNISVLYSYSQTSNDAALTWTVDQTRANATGSNNSRWSNQVTVRSTDDFAFSLSQNWNGLGITNGAAALTLSVRDSSNNDIVFETAAVLSGNLNGSVAGVHGGLLSANETYTFSIDTILFYLGDEATRSRVSSAGIFSLSIATVPEPSSLSLLSVAFLLLRLRSRGKRPAYSQSNSRQSI